MRFAGGKAQIGQQIAAYLNAIREPGQPYWEPFVGAANVAQYIGPGPNYFSDAHADLVDLLKAVRRGWEPPGEVSAAEYKAARDMDPCPLRTFIGYGLSFSGKWWGGYARNVAGEDGGRNYARESTNLVRKVNYMRTPLIFQADFLDADIPIKYMGNLLIYCDPPYKGTIPLKQVDPFDHDKFWDKLRTLGDAGHEIVVSEFQAPDDFSEVNSWSLMEGLRKNGDGTRKVERLFRYGDHPPIQARLI